MHDVVGRVSDFRSGFLAQIELRLEAARRPELRRLLTERVRADLDANIDFHTRAGFPGGETSVTLLYLALNWLILERLTLPDVISEERARALVDAAVERVVPGSDGSA